MDTSELIFEIGTEELPASFITYGMALLKKNFSEILKNHKIKFNEIKVFGTPRRIGIAVEEISLKQEDSITEQTGPAKRVAFDENGNPTKAAIGFARSQCVDVKELIIVETPKGEYVAARKVVKGELTKKILEKKFPEFLKSIVFPKNMRWGNEKISFGRPIKWIVAKLGDEVVNFEYGSYRSGDKSRGHRFLSPEEFEFENYNDYVEKLKKKWVIPDFNVRKELLWYEIKKLLEGKDVEVERDEELLEEVTNLVEYPFPIIGKFDEEFLKIPEEVIITSMKVHQKYFPVRDKKGKLLNYFVTVSNMKAKDMNVIRIGNERVLRARLNDAKFFYEEDKKYKLDYFVENLRKVVFYSKLGTSYEKMERFKEIATYLAGILNPDKIKITERAAYLCKGDLETNMVYEFPELQGIMGKYYALHSGESEEVATAIYEHYLPRFSGDELPSTDAGAFISIADRIDSITGFFIIGEIPSGNADPFALRRHALAIINILLNKKYRISLIELIDRAIKLYIPKFEKIDSDVKIKILDFIKQRFRNFLSENFNYDEIDAVIDVDFDDVFRSYKKIEALHEMKKDENFINLIIPFKRIANITKDWDETVVVEEYFNTNEEKELYDIFKIINENFQNLVKNESYIDALKELTKLRGPIDNFFDNVLVMEKDEKLKKNRLSLLKSIYKSFISIGDLKKLQN